MTLRAAAIPFRILILVTLVAAIALTAISQEPAGSATPENKKLIRIRATPKPKNVSPAKQTPLLKVERTALPNGGLPEPDDFMLKFDYLFGAKGKLRPTPTPQIVAEDRKTTAQRVAEMIREMRANSTPRPVPVGSDWLTNATPAPAGYIAPTQKPTVRVATPPPKSNLPPINLGGDGTSSYP